MRNFIALIGTDPLLSEVELMISDLVKGNPGSPALQFKNFSTIDQINSYIEDPGYEIEDGKPGICFGVYLNQTSRNNFNYSLHYFDTLDFGDTPNGNIASLDYFQNGPDMISYTTWLKNGYLQIMKVVNTVILRQVCKNKNANINFGVMAQKYSVFRSDPFTKYMAFVAPLFIAVAYTCPLCLLVLRMVKEKESKLKEGMKIMGLTETVYFLSFFLHWLLLNTIYAVINSFILNSVFTHIGYFYIYGFIWLFGMCIFSMAFFFQALMDKTKVAIWISLMIYFSMLILSIALVSDQVSNVAKMLVSLLPPTCLYIGVFTLSKFEGSYNNLKPSEVTLKYNNYSISDMYLMFSIDIFVFIFLGYYCQNVLVHQFGIRKPWNFLCIRSFWCRNRKTKNKEIGTVTEQNELKVNMEKEHDHEIEIEKGKFHYEDFSDLNFQSEDIDIYKSNIASGDCLQIKDLKKIFDDGKTAVDGLNLNLYNNEIFALLGSNGAGKSTTISILSGLYEATGGKVMYKGLNILEDEHMQNFRSRLGICPQHDVQFDDLSVEEHLDMFCIFKGVPHENREEEIKKILKDVHMTDIHKELAKNLSGGEKRKLSIAIALVGGSQIVFLDEPSSGMDVASRRNLWDILKKCARDRIIILTTHYMEEAAVLGNRIGIVTNGKLKCCGSELFLINRFGKYLSLNIFKQPDSQNQEIINFLKSRISGVSYEVLSEEILFQIDSEDYEINEENKDCDKSCNDSANQSNVQKLSLKNLFNDIDENMNELKIKSYEVSLPNLEDVFLNVTAVPVKNVLVRKSTKLGIFQNSDKGKFEYNKSETPMTGMSKFCRDLKCTLNKRLLQIIRDKMNFILEILCPIILVLIGLVLNSFNFVSNTPSLDVKLNLLPENQTIVLNQNLYTGQTLPVLNINDNFNANMIYQKVSTSSDVKSSLVLFNDLIYNSNYTNSYGSYYIIGFDKLNQKYDFVTFVNTQARNSPIIYAQYMMNQIMSLAANEQVNVNYSYSPLPRTNLLIKQGDPHNRSNLIFFVSIAFALIPANCIIQIVREKQTNAKHLQIISGISLTSYWVANFLFDILKYYLIGGISLILILAFKNFPFYLWLLFLVYALPMTSFTYMISIFFVNESSAQNTIILINFLFGALGGNIIFIFRVIQDLVPKVKTLSYILRVFPSYAFSYAYNQIQSAQLLFYLDYPDKVFEMSTATNTNIIKMEYIGTDLIYLGVEFILFSLILIIWESSKSCCRPAILKNSSLSSNYIKNINDSVVLSEIAKADLEQSNQYPIRINKLEKIYGEGCSSKKIKAVDNLSICIEPGECFALLGVNGAGKTSTFKLMTSEILKTHGNIYINGSEIDSNFVNDGNIIGYCPQFDAIFEYMTVFENLDFYARLKGIPNKKVEFIVNTLMAELNLSEYRNKTSGDLSGGNKRKVSVGIAMIGSPQIILLDEPSTGMDPKARRFMWSVIHKISTRSNKASVILTTHSMEEAETLCRRVGIMISGQFKCLGTSQDIKDKYGYGYEINLRIHYLSDQMLDNTLKQYELDINYLINDREKIEAVLIKIGKFKYISLLNSNHIGRELIQEVRKYFY